MKKAYFQFGRRSGHIVPATLATGREVFRCITGVEALDGETLFESGGAPFTFADLENAISDARTGEDEASAEAAYRAAEAFVSNPATPWEPIAEDDAAWVAEWLGIWGLAPIREVNT